MLRRSVRSDSSQKLLESSKSRARRKAKKTKSSPSQPVTVTFQSPSLSGISWLQTKLRTWADWFEALHALKVNRLMDHQLPDVGSTTIAIDEYWMTPPQEWEVKHLIRGARAMSAHVRTLRTIERNLDKYVVSIEEYSLVLCLPKRLAESLNAAVNAVIDESF